MMKRIEPQKVEDMIEESKVPEETEENTASKFNDGPEPLEKEPLGIIYCVCSNLQEISDRKIYELEALLTSEIEN